MRMHVIRVSFSSDWDESVYVLTAQAWLNGGLPYVAVWDQHPVGLPAIIALGGWITGDTLVAARFESAIATALGAWIVTRFAWPLRVRWLGGLVYVLLMSRLDGIAAQTEPFNATLVAAASLLLFRSRNEAGRGGLAKAAAAALVLGCALQVKYSVVPECVLLCCLHLWHRRVSGEPPGRLLWRALLMLGCGIAPTIAAGGYFAALGQFQPFIAANLYANAAYIGLIPSWAEFLYQFRLGARPLLPLAVIAMLLAWPGWRRMRHPGARTPETAAVAWIGAWIIAAVIDISLPMKFWPHYFLMLYAPLCAALPFAVDALRRMGARHSEARWMGPGLAVVLALFVLGDVGHSTWNNLRLLGQRVRNDVPRRIADAITADGAGGVYVFDYHPIIYQLAHATPPTRFVLPSELGASAASSGVDPVAELRAILAAAPRYIVTADPPLDPLTPELRGMMRAELRGYAAVLSLRDGTDDNRDVTLYARQPVAEKAMPQSAEFRPAR